MNLGAEVRSLVEALELQGHLFGQKNVDWTPQLEASFGRESGRKADRNLRSFENQLTI